MQAIINFKIIDPQIASGGQPTFDQLIELADTGCQVVINLALPTSANAIPNEGELVTQLGLTYVHIPVIWDEPHLDDFQQFLGCMEVFREKKVFVHCARNMRVSCFLYLYRVIAMGLNPEIAADDMLSVWQPNETWQRFITQVLDHYEITENKEQKYD